MIGDDTGLGMISAMKAEGAYTANEDGTYDSADYRTLHRAIHLQQCFMITMPVLDND